MSSSEFSATSSISFSRYSVAWSESSSGIGTSFELPLPSPSYSNAFMSIRSITPRTSCSLPIGISVATTCWPKASLSASSVRKKSARSRSSMFTNTSRARPSASARCHSRSVWTSTPMTPLTTITAASATRSAASVSATKLGSPGVSMRLILRPSCSKEAMPAPIDIWRACSSGSWSSSVLPSSTLPSRLTIPASNRIASARLVFPLPLWPTRATLRIRSGGFMPTVAIYAFGLALEAGAQAQHGLGVQLGHARLRDAEHLADLAQSEVLVVVERDHEPLALGQPFDRVGQPVFELPGHRLGVRVDGPGVLDRAEDGDLAAASLGVGERPQVIERQHGGVRDLEQGILKLVDRHLQTLGHLLVGRGALEPRLQLGVGLLDVARSRAHGAWDPVEGAQLVDDRPLDPGDREGLELDLALEVEALDRPDEAQQPVGDQVRFLDVRRQPGGHAARDELDQRRIRHHQTLAGALVAVRLVATPQLPQLDCLDVGLHAYRPSRVRTLPARGRPRAACCRSASHLSSKRSTHGDGHARTRAAAAMAQRGCRSASSRRSSARAAPGSSAGRPHPRACVWRTRVARCRGSGERRAAPARRSEALASCCPFRSRAPSRTRSRDRRRRG